MADRLSRYRDFALFLTKYGRANLVADPADAATQPPTENAEEFSRDVEALGPTFIKLGQLLSTRADVLPAAYAEALERLQDDVEPFPAAEAIAIIEEELGVRVSKLFSSFDEKPLAAASLGQVHRGVLRSGREVAVKVQRPGVHERVLQDLETLDELASLLQRFGTTTRHLDPSRLVDEFRQTILSELDYRQEARNLTSLAHQLRDFEDIVIPLPVDDYTTSRVLTMDYVAGTKITAVSPVAWTEIKGRKLADTLFRAYLQQILVDGLFHADPHPGNVLLTDDRRLGLIDLGMVGHLTSHTQDALLRLMLAIVDGRGDEATTAVIALGERLDDFDEAATRSLVSTMLGRYGDARARELNVGRVMLELCRSGNRIGLRLASELALLGKTLLNLDTIGRTLDPDFEVNASMRRHATAMVRRRMLKAATPSHLLSSSLELRDLAERLPKRLNQVLDALAGNDLRLKIEVIDHGSIIDGLQKVANRIALGVVLAALIVGAALLMRVPTRLTILGYPGIAMLLFLAAAAGGVWMAWTILASDVRRTRTR